VVNHGLQTGDVVVYDPEGNTSIGGLTTTFTDNTTSPATVTARPYNVISLGANDLALGSQFDGSSIDPATDTLTFQTPHNFQSGDAVEYEPGPGAATIGGLTAGSTYYVRVLDGLRIKLEPTLDRAINPDNYLSTFNPSGITGGNTIHATNSFTPNEAVTYEAPAPQTFDSIQVDVNNDTGDGGVAKNRHSGHARRNLLEQLDPFRAHAVFEGDKSGGVTSRPR